MKWSGWINDEIVLWRCIFEMIMFYKLLRKEFNVEEFSVKDALESINFGTMFNE